MDGRRYYPVGVFEADASALFPWPPQSRLWRAYKMGYIDTIEGRYDRDRVPGDESNFNSERGAYVAGGADATAGLAVPWLNEVAPEPPPPIIPETAEGSVMESETDPLFIAGGDNG